MRSLRIRPTRHIVPSRTCGETMSESHAPVESGTDVRCHCGKLIARWQGDNLVIKCTRCGRFVRISSSAIAGTPPPDLTSGPRR